MRKLFAAATAAAFLIGVLATAGPVTTAQGPRGFGSGSSSSSSSTGGGTTFTNGDTVNTTGTGFGSTGPTLLLLEMFETGIPGSPTVGSWSIDTRPAPTYDTATPHSGTGSPKFAYGTNGDGSDWWGGFLYDITQFYSKTYQSYWWRNGGSGISTEGVCKLNQVHGTPGTGNFAPGWMNGSSFGGWFSAITREDGTDSNDVITQWWGGANETMMNTVNQWRHIEMLGKQSSAANVADGRADFRINGTSMKNITSVVTRTTTNGRWNETTFLHGGNVNGTTSKNMWTDDFYFQSGWMRVMLHNSSTLGASSITVPQRVTSWSNTSIDYTLIQGALSTGTIYESVVDDNDSVVQTRTLTLNSLPFWLLAWRLRKRAYRWSRPNVFTTAEGWA